MSEHLNLDPKKIGKYIISHFPMDSCKGLYTCIIETARILAPGSDDLVIYMFADRIQKSIRTAVDSHIEEYEERKLPPRVYWSELNTDRLVGRCFVHRNDSSEVKSLKQKLLLMEQVQNAVGSLPWGDFERLCCKLIPQIDSRYTQVRRRRHNGGIDFHGVYVVSETHRIRFAGQAKKYGIGKMIGPNLIRELSGAMSNGRWAIGVIMATCKFTQGARKLAKEKNIDAIDGEQIAYRLIRSNIGIINNGQPIFSEEEFNSWLR